MFQTVKSSFISGQKPAFLSMDPQLDYFCLQKKNKLHKHLAQFAHIYPLFKGENVVLSKQGKMWRMQTFRLNNVTADYNFYVKLSSFWELILAWSHY